MLKVKTIRLGKFPHNINQPLTASQGPHVPLTPVLAQLARANFAVHVSVPALLVPAHVDGYDGAMMCHDLAMGQHPSKSGEHENFWHL